MPGKLIWNSGKWTPRILLKKKRKFPAETLNLSIINHIFLLLTEIITNINLVLINLCCIMELNIFLYSSLSNRFSQTFLRSCSLAFLLKYFSVTAVLRVDTRLNWGWDKMYPKLHEIFKSRSRRDSAEPKFVYVDPPQILLPNAVADAGLGTHSQEGGLFRKNFNKLHEIEKKNLVGRRRPFPRPPRKEIRRGNFS